MPRPHVCLLNCLHPSDDVRVVEKWARALSAEGFRVSWIGPQLGNPASGERFGVEYHFFEPGKGRLGRLVHNHRRLFELGTVVARADAYIGMEPDSARIAVRLADRYRAHSVFDVHEPYEDEMLRRWVPGMLHKPAALVVGAALRRLCADVSVVVGVNGAVLEPYLDVPTMKLIVRNCAPASFADGETAAVCSPGHRLFTAMQGKSSGNHGTRAVIEAFGLVAREIPTASVVLFEAFDAQLTREEFDRCVRAAGAESVVDLRPRISMPEMPAVLRTCDVGLIAYARVLGEKSLPNKLFEFMAAGLPIIAPTYADEIRRVIEAEKCGVLVDCERPEEIAAALVQLHENPTETAAMGRRAKEAFVARHSFEADVRPLVELVRSWAA